MTIQEIAELFNKVSLGAVAVISMIVGPLLQWFIASRQARLQDAIATRQAGLHEAIAKRQVADSIATKRLVWVDGLRNDVSSLLGLYSFVFNLFWVESAPARKLPDSKMEADRVHSLWHKVSETMIKASELSVRIRLRLNQEALPQDALLAHLDRARDLLNEVHVEGNLEKSLDEWDIVSQRIISCANVILDVEWEKVKLGVV